MDFWGIQGNKMLLNCHPGLLQKLMERGYYTAFGRTSISGGTEIRKSDPIIQQNMFMVYIGLAIGTFLALTSFGIEIALGKCLKRENEQVAPA